MKELVKTHGQKIRTDSLIVAQEFGKPHKNIIRKIEKLIRENKNSRLKIEPRDYTDDRGKTQKYYEMNRRAFSILVMSFTGEKALKWKNSFYDAFEAMEKKLMDIQIRQQSLEWQHHRIEGKAERHRLTDSIKDFVEYAELMGSGNASRYYTTFTKMIYRELFDMKHVPDGFRNSMNERSLKRLMCAEDLVSDWIQDTMATCSDYHDVYFAVRDRVQKYVDATGKIDLGQKQLEMADGGNS